MEYWPSNLIPVRPMFRIKPMLSAGPRTFSGKKQLGGVDAGYWVATLDAFPIASPDQILDWRGVIAAMQGGLEDLIIGPFDELQAPAEPGYPLFITDIPFSDGSRYSDGSGHSQKTVIVTLNANLPLRATQASLTKIAGAALRRGMYFSLRNRLHMITKEPQVSGSTITIQFLPPLRLPASAGDDVEFADPKATMCLSNPDGGDLPLDYGRWSTPSIELEESWNGL